MADKPITDAGVINQILNALPEVSSLQKGLQSKSLLTISDAPPFEDANEAPVGAYNIYDGLSKKNFPFNYGVLFTIKGINGVIFQFFGGLDSHLAIRVKWDGWGVWRTII